jgi:hypothetical protein
MNMNAAPNPSADVSDFLSAHLLAVRSVVDALIASHPDPGAFLQAHEQQLAKLRSLQDRAGKPIGLQQAQTMHDFYSNGLKRSQARRKVQAKSL